jgi:hypothetical protein
MVGRDLSRNAAAIATVCVDSRKYDLLTFIRILPSYVGDRTPSLQSLSLGAGAERGKFYRETKINIIIYIIKKLIYLN